MILCEKCNKLPAIDPIDWKPYYCKVHQVFTRQIFEKESKIPCAVCAKEKGICQKCGCEIPATKEEIDKLIEQLKNTKNDPNIVFVTAPHWPIGDKK